MVKKMYRYSDGARAFVERNNAYAFTKPTDDLPHLIYLARRMESLGFKVFIEQESPHVSIYRLFVSRKSVDQKLKGKFGAPKKRAAKKKPARRSAR